MCDSLTKPMDNTSTLNDVESDSDSDWEDEEAPHLNDEGSSHLVVKCIFTGNAFPSPEDYYSHLKSSADFDIWRIVRCDLELDFFGYVKLVNYLRKSFVGCSPPSVDQLLETRSTWDQEVFLKPVIPDDPLLQFMIDEDENDVVLSLSDETSSLSRKECDHDRPLGKDEVSLKRQFSALQEKNKALELHLKEACSKISDMKAFMKDCILTGDMYRPVSACRMQQTLEEESFEDSGYFNSYSHHDIHAEMLQDKVRTCAYRDAILSNPDAFKDKVVLDVGCGTAILSMFAVKAGAKHVYAVDMSDVAYHAMDIVHENKLQDKITVIKGFVEEVSLPVSKVDIIISEWMGYFLLYESMLDSVIFAAEKWLSEGGIILPDSCEISLVGIHDEQLFQQHVQFWDDVYGFQMKCVKNVALRDASVQTASPSSVISDVVTVMKFCMMSVSVKNLNYKTDFVLTAKESGKLSAIVGYFDVHFKHGLKHPVSFSTAPWHTTTHWKQTVFFLAKPIYVEKGEKIKGFIDCHKHPKDPRSLQVQLTIGNSTSVYSVS